MLLNIHSTKKRKKKRHTKKELSNFDKKETGEYIEQTLENKRLKFSNY